MLQNGLNGCDDFRRTGDEVRGVLSTLDFSSTLIDASSASSVLTSNGSGTNSPATSASCTGQIIVINKILNQV